MTVKIDPGINVTSGGKPVKEMVLNDDMSGNTTVLNLGFLRWFVIKRGKRFGIRLRNLDADLVKEFDGTGSLPD